MDRTDVGHRREHYHRAPTDHGATGALLPSRGTGTQDEGYERMTVTPAEGDLRLDVSGSIRLGTHGIRSHGRTTLTEGHSAYVTLSWGASRVPSSLAFVATLAYRLVSYWLPVLAGGPAYLLFRRRYGAAWRRSSAHQTDK